MAGLSYRLGVVGYQQVEQALSKIEKRLAKQDRLLKSLGQTTKRVSQEARRTEATTQKANLREFQKAQRQREREAKTSAQRIERERKQAAKSAAREEARQAKEVARKRLQYERSVSRKVSQVRKSVGGALRGGARVVGGAAALVGGFSAAQGISNRLSADTASAGLANRVISSGTSGGKSFGDVRTEIFNRSRGLQEEFGLENQGSVIALESGFNEKAGDFGAGSKLTRELLQLSQAVGMSEGELESLGLAAGNTFASLKNAGKDSEAAAKATSEAMRAAVGQGSKGSISAQDFSKIGGRLVAVANSLGGDSATNIGRVNALANVGVLSTGSAETSSTAIEAIARDAVAKRKAFQNLGVDTLDAKGNTRDLQDILVESSLAAGGDQTQMRKLFGEEAGRLAQGFFKQVREGRSNGMSDADIEAQMRAPLEALNSATLNEAQVKEQAADMANRDAAKFQRAMGRLQNSLGEKLLPVLTNELLPVFEEMTPHIVTLVEAFADAVEFFAKNPFSGIGLIVAGSVAKDIASAKIGEAVTGAITGATGGGGGSLGTVFGKQGTVFGKLASAAMLAGAAKVGWEIGKGLSDAIVGAGQENSETMLKTSRDNSGALTSGSLADKKARLQETQKQIQNFDKKMNSFSPGGLAAQANVALGELTGVEDPQIAARKQLLADYNELQEQINREERAKLGAIKASREAYERELSEQIDSVFNRVGKPPGQGSFY